MLDKNSFIPVLQEFSRVHHMTMSSWGMEQLEVEVLFLSILSLGVFVYFWKENLAYLPHRCSQITRICGICGAHGTSLLNMFLFLESIEGVAYLTLYILPGQNGIRGEECHTLRSRLLIFFWNLSSLAGIFLLEEPWAIYIYLSGCRSTPNSTVGHLSIFSARLSDTCPFLFPQISYFCIAHASNAISLRKSESFIFLKRKYLMFRAW